MKKAIALAVLVALSIPTGLTGLEKKAFMMREDFGAALLQGCTLQYYYYVPCPRVYSS